MAYQTNKEETKNIRTLFKNDPSLAKYKLRRNGHGSGTAYNWIQVVATYPDGMYTDDDQIWEERSRIKWLIQVAVGRGNLKDDIQTDYFCVNIIFDLQSESKYKERNSWKEKKKAALLKNKTCPNCGTISKEFRRDGYRYIRACRKCETQWTHGAA